MKWDRLGREMSFLEIAESDTWGEETFLQCSRTENRLVYDLFFPLSICSLIESNTPLRNILLIYVNLDTTGQGAKDPPTFLQP